MTKKLYVGNLNFDTTEEQIREMLGQFGTIDSLAMINDRDTGRFRGFCFVEMEDSSANAAINGLNDTLRDGRSLRVNEALPRDDNRGNRRQNNFPGGRRR